MTPSSPATTPPAGTPEPRTSPGERPKLLAVTPKRAMTESAIVAFALTLPLAAILRPALDLTLGATPDGVERWPVLGLSMVYVSVVSAAVGALRLRSREDTVRRAMSFEIAAGVGVIVALWAGAAAGHGVGALAAALRGGVSVTRDLTFAAYAPLLALGMAVEGALTYVIARAVALLMLHLNRLRRRRLFWALVQTQLVAALVVSVSISALLVAINAATGTIEFGPPFGPENLHPEAGSAAMLLAWVATRLLPAVRDLVLLAMVVSLAVLPIASLVSYLALRRTTQRIEALATASETLRDGNVEVQVPVEGEDEVARLQISFNAMAADLGRTLHDLEAERDRVAGLLQARRHLVAAVSHELRTPIATARAYLEAALRRDGPEPVATNSRDPGIPSEPGESVKSGVPAALRTDLETVAREIERLERQVDDLFTLSRAEVDRLELRPTPVDTGALVRRMVETAAPVAWQLRRVQVLAQAPESLPPAMADEARLEQIVSNLLSNALRHTPPGGLVVVAAEAEPEGIRLEVRDTGEGIAPADLPLVFERFYRGTEMRVTAEEERDGAGLGLALVKELAEAMGGTVSVTSAPGEGSCFTVRLPRA